VEFPKVLKDCNNCRHHIQGEHPATVAIEKGPYGPVTCQDCLGSGMDYFEPRARDYVKRKTLNDATPQEWDAVRQQPTGPHAEAARRKATPIFSGCLMYFPDAIAEVSRVSVAGNNQHHPDKPLHWDKSKSKDEADACVRHLMDSKRSKYDTDGTRHAAKAAWRALANLQRELDEESK
jgi:hypothetical protein